MQVFAKLRSECFAQKFVMLGCKTKLQYEAFPTILSQNVVTFKHNFSKQELTDKNLAVFVKKL